MLHGRFRRSWILSLGALVWSALAGSGVAAPAGVDPQADRILRHMSSYLAAAGQFSFRAHDMADEILETGQRVQFSNIRNVSVRRPNKVAVDISGDLVDDRMRYDGKTLTIFDRRENAYGVIQVPDNIDAMCDYTAQYFGVTMPLADLLLSDPYGAIIGDVRLGHYVGLHQVNGVKCHHLAFQHASLDWQIWIQDSDKPLPRKLVITYKTVPGQPQYIALLDDWNLSANLPDGLFTLEPPKGARKVELKSVTDRLETGLIPVEESGAVNEDVK